MKEYSLPEVLKMLNISRATWKRRKEEIIAYINTFWDYELLVQKNGNIKFKVDDECDALILPQLPFKSRESIRDHRAFYCYYIFDTLKKNKYQTGFSIAIICKILDIMPPDKQYSVNALRKILAPMLRDIYNSVPPEYVETVWVHKVPMDIETLNCYMRVSDEHIQEFVDMFSRYYLDERNARNVLNIIAEDAYNGVPTKENLAVAQKQGLINPYKEAILEFRDLHGYVPFKIKVINDDYVLQHLDIAAIVEQVLQIEEAKDEEKRLKKLALKNL